MKKYFPFIAAVFIAFAVLVSILPDYEKSRQPLNKFLSFGKANGFAVGILTDDAASAEKEIKLLEQTINRTVHVKFFSRKEQAQISSELSLSIPSFLIADGDGNLAVTENSAPTAEKLAKIFSGLHTH